VVQTLLSQAGLKDILRAESALVSEIRTLDGERKALVYDNYSKLIEAVETIAEMQKGISQRGGGLDGVDELTGRLADLEKLVADMGGPRESRGGALRTDGDDEEALRVKKKQERVRWVLNAPERLRAIEGSEEAELEWARIKRWLDRWEGARGVGEVRSACEVVMKNRSMTSGNDAGSPAADDDDGDASATDSPVDGS
jgi:vacuolar protein sorting-associated protein 51